MCNDDDEWLLYRIIVQKQLRSSKYKTRTAFCLSHLKIANKHRHSKNRTFSLLLFTRTNDEKKNESMNEIQNCLCINILEWWTNNALINVYEYIWAESSHALCVFNISLLLFQSLLCFAPLIFKYTWCCHVYLRGAILLLADRALRSIQTNDKMKKSNIDYLFIYL